MRLNRIRTEDCGALASLEVEGLAPGLNVILGPNGSGKTSLLRFVRDLLARPKQHVSQGLPAAGVIEMESRSGPLRVLRIPRPGHPDTLAVVAATSLVTDQARTDDDSAAPLLRFVEPVNLHQTPALAALAGKVTEQLAARELGPNWSHVRAASALPFQGHEAPARLMAVLSRLAVVQDEGSALDTLISGDLTANDANWRTVIGALARQREQLSLECEAHTRKHSRQQREWETRLRWLGEYAAEQLAEVSQLDADWQAADSDAREIRPATHGATAAVVNATQTGALSTARTLQDSLELLQQVLEDLAQDRMRVLLAMARSSGEQESLDSDRRHIDGCEREIVGQMQRLMRRHASGSSASCVCPTCGATQAVDHAPGSETPAESSISQNCAELWKHLSAARERWSATQRRIVRLERWRARRGVDATIDWLRYRIKELDAQIEELEAHRQIDMSASVIALRHDVDRRHDLLKQAGSRLASLTGGRYVSLRWNPEASELLAEGNDGQLTSVIALSRGTHEQVAMALRLAVLHGLAELGSSGPVVWDEPLADSDEQRLDAAAEQLAQFAQTDAQLLLLTCREHVARAMESHGAVVHRIGAVTAASEPDTIKVQDVVAESFPAPDVAPVRVHPGSTFWLHLDSPLEQVPSLSPQQIRPLWSLGIADVRDLLEFDPAVDSARLMDVQITPALLQIWQAEARLLTQVGDLTGRDAQLLVSCGILSRSELAAADTDELTRRIDRMRGGDTLRWRLGPSTSPHRETIERWVESARRQPPADPSRWTETAGQSRRKIERSSARRALPARAAAPPTPPAVALRFRLQSDSPIVDAPSIGHKTGRRLERVGIATVRDLLVCDPHQTATRLRHRRITADTVLAWQRQAVLMCSVPDLRCADAIVLVACGVTGPLDLLRISPAALYATLEPFMFQAAGQRLLRGATPPTFQDVQRWIETVEESRVRRAA